MARYKYPSKFSTSDLRQQVVLPTYKLDSNLVLLPGIIYNVTFSRFKAAALLSRFRYQVPSVSVIKNLLNEYDFNNHDGIDTEDVDGNPTTISNDSVNGIKEFYRFEHLSKRNFSTSGGLDSEINLSNEFDWLTLAISPNLSKIKDPNDSSLESAFGNVVTVVRVVGIIDDTTNIKLTLQALVRGVQKSNYKSVKPNEKLFEIDWNYEISNINGKFETLHSNALALFKSIDKFIVDYRQALNSSNNSKNSTSPNKSSGNLLTLNPLANALYLQLAGSKDFTKAYISLQKLYGTFNSNSGSKIDDKSFLRLIDLTCAIIPFPNHEKLNLLNKFKLSERINEVNLMIDQMITILKNLNENNQFISHWFYSEATNIQKANVVANQLKSIRLVLEGMTNTKNMKQFNSNQNSNQNKLIRRRVPQNKAMKASEDENEEEVDDDDDDDELRSITDFVKNKLPSITTLSNDTKRLIIKDYKRIKSSPPGNSDFHVIRNYLEIVADIPWDKYVTKFKSNKDINLELAKKQLDDDHYGLEHVKRRLIQYLVVLKLLGINAEKEFEKNEIERSKEVSKSKSGAINQLSDDSSIIIANNDETSSAQEAAKNKNIKSKAAIEQQSFDKSLIISKNNKSPIIMLAGPPGTGKTSLAKSIAKSLGRNFQRISLGGIKDESEIRGHRRTYVGAMPGVIIQSLRKSRSMNPVILLDEIDKVVGGNNSVNKFNGDPSAALLEVLDPEQNSAFIDHYIGFPVDLSQVIFICTANEPHNLSKPLLDRLEMIEVGAYDYNEKLIIGEKYLLPRQIRRNGLPSNDLIKIDKDVMKKIIINYTREAGVRNFERRLGTICRFKAVEYSQHLGNLKNYNPNIEEYDLPKYLGIPYPSLSSEIIESPLQSSKYGVVNGLSYNSDGSGSVLIFESIGFNHESSKSSLNMTGRLGDVLMESAKIGLTFIKSIIFRNLLNLDIDAEALIEKFNSLEIHLHVPSGSISKDGPSAGITMALSFLSLILEKPVPYDIAMTGEITLRGLVLPIGGLKEKLLGAHLSGIKRVIVPRENRKDLIEEYVKCINDDSQLNNLLKDNESKCHFKNNKPELYFLNKFGIKIYYASEFWDVIKVVWGDEILVKVDQSKIIEYHL